MRNRLPGNGGRTRLPFANSQFEDDYKECYKDNVEEIVDAYGSKIEVLRKYSSPTKYSSSSREKVVFDFIAIIDHSPSESIRKNYGIVGEGSKTLHTSQNHLDKVKPHKVREKDLILFEGKRYLIRTIDKDGTFLGISGEIIFVIEEATR